MNKLITLSLLFFLFVSGCSHNEFHKTLEENKCENALTQIPELQPHYEIINGTRVFSGYVLSYAATGTTYTAEYLWAIVKGTLFSVVLCLPTIAAESVSSGPHSERLTCLPAPSFMGKDPLDFRKTGEMGQTVYSKTQQWRCPNMDSLSGSLRSVAQCYENRGDKDSLMKGLAQLNDIATGVLYKKCVSEKEMKLVRENLDRVIKKLNQ